MKKLIPLLLILAMLAGCTSSASGHSDTAAAAESITIPTIMPAAIPASASEAEPAEPFTVEACQYNTDDGAIQYFLIIRNNTQDSVSILGTADAADAAGTVLGTEDMQIDVLGPGEESIGYFYFDNIGEIDSIDYRLEYSYDPAYAPVLSNLEAEVSVEDREAVVTVTNNGTIAAEYVEAFVLFYDAEDQLLYENDIYIADSDSEIKPGEALTDRVSCLVETPFDHVAVYLTGRGRVD